MRVYLINSVYKYGSTGNICADIKNRLEASGATCRIAYGRGEKSDRNNGEYRIANKRQVFIHILLTRLTDRHGCFSDTPTKKLIQDIVDFAPDVIHLHNIHGYFINYEILFRFLRFYKRPIVWTLHDCWPFTGHCAYFDAIHCEKWKTQCESCKLIHEYPKTWVLDRAKQNYEKKRQAFTNVDNLHIVVPSFWLKRKVQESFLKSYPIEVIYNGVDMKKFYPRNGNRFREKIGASSKKIILGVANIWASQKGLARFLELNECLDDSYLIVLVGITKNQKRRIPKRICSIDRTKDMDELAEIYSAADVYFNASIEETMGMTTVEALACGTPVVVYNRTAIPEVVPQGGGIILEPGNIRDVKEAIDALLKERKKNCSEMVQAFEKSRKYDQYLSLYQRI